MFIDFLPCYSVLKLIFGRVDVLFAGVFAFGFVGVFLFSKLSMIEAHTNTISVS